MILVKLYFLIFPIMAELLPYFCIDVNYGTKVAKPPKPYTKKLKITDLELVKNVYQF